MASISVETVDSDLPPCTQSSQLSISSSPEEDRTGSFFWYASKKENQIKNAIYTIDFYCILLPVSEIKIFVAPYLSQTVKSIAMQDMASETRLEQAARCVQLAWKKIVGILGVEALEDWLKQNQTWFSVCAVRVNFDEWRKIKKSWARFFFLRMQIVSHSLKSLSGVVP